MIEFQSTVFLTVPYPSLIYREGARVRNRTIATQPFLAPVGMIHMLGSGRFAGIGIENNTLLDDPFFRPENDSEFLAL